MLNPVPRPEPRKRTKGRARRVESKVVQQVRAEVAARDGFCRLFSYAWDVYLVVGSCEGDSEWAHLGDKRRYKTRRMAPAQRHSREWTIQLCSRHHRDYDEHRIDIQPATSRGADGPLEFQCGATVYVEPDK